MMSRRKVKIRVNVTGEYKNGERFDRKFDYVKKLTNNEIYENAEIRKIAEKYIFGAKLIKFSWEIDDKQGGE